MDHDETALPGSTRLPKEKDHSNADGRQGHEPEAAVPVPDNALEILRKEFPALSVSRAETKPPESLSEESSAPCTQTPPLDAIPIRMLNEFVYCPRLFYYEFVEGIFVENADTLRGSAIHQRVDSGTGAMPKAGKIEVQGSKFKAKAADEAPGPSKAEGQIESPKSDIENEIIHSRSVQMGSDRLGVTAKMDLVEARPASDPDEADLFAIEVCPVDYKAGAPRQGDDGNELWDTDKMQLGLQCLILRDNGYNCREGVIYYRATKQRVRLPITPELEQWVLENVAAARRTATGPIPEPLVASPKCPRCSLVTVCLPDETRLLAESYGEKESSRFKVQGSRLTEAGERPAGEEPGAPAVHRKPQAAAPVRRLIAPRDDKRAVYLNTQGWRVGRKDEVLQIKEKDKLIDEARISDVSHVALFGNIQISTQTVQALCENEVPISYFSMGGWFYGVTRGHELKNVFLRMEQFRLAREPGVCLKLARRFVHGKIRNHRTMLMRNHLEPSEAIVAKLKNSAETALKASSIDELLGVEGAAANFYFQQFSGMIKAEELPIDGEPEAVDGSRESREVQGRFNFNFTNRNRRPPTDPVNAMLSLAYSLLSKDCVLAVLAVGFDPYVGFYHQPRFGRPALALDLMEEFRPLIAESTVLSCINNRVVTEKDFVRAGQAVNLSPAGRKRFFQMYEQRMNALITHPVFDYKVSYRRALELQARLLSKALTGEFDSYAPFVTR